MPTIYVIAGCNGAGKSTAANVILPQFLNCKEFVNADSIAAGLSPFQPETVSFQAGRIMLSRIKELISEGSTFAFETTLTTKSYLNIIKEAKAKRYKIVLLYFWLNSVELALARIADRVKKGGHNIPKDVVIRRYERSLHNLLNMFMPICDKWYIEDNSSEIYSEIAKGRMSNSTRIYDNEKWSIINDYKN
ncbi:MAG TPA: zeta toxin family protein [Ignavibacteria bacterium]|nr:zeta toxin family protein [Ignavibacteria bacterium]